MEIQGYFYEGDMIDTQTQWLSGKSQGIKNGFRKILD